MRKYPFVLLALCVSPFFSQAQNTFPTTGNVGVGTSTPLYPLHVSSNSAVGLVVESTAPLSISSGAFLRAYNEGNPTAPNQRLGGILFGTNPTGTTVRTGAQIEALTEAAWTDGSIQPTYLRFLTTPSTAGAAAVERMRITADGGIMLPVAGQFGISLTDRYTYDGKFQPHYGMQWVMDTWSASGPTLWASAYGGMKFMTQSIPRITISGGGNVGIGTEDTKGYKFAVNGDAVFTRIKVKSYAAWPDYVFDEEYKLPPLAEIAAYVKEHKHLPEIPAAAEIEKDGLDVAEMNKQLLKKVEELTLYLIQQQKDNEATLKRIKILEGENERVTREIEKLKDTSRK